MAVIQEYTFVRLHKVRTGMKRRLRISRNQINLDVDSSEDGYWKWFGTMQWGDKDFFDIAQAIFELLDKKEQEQLCQQRKS